MIHDEQPLPLLGGIAACLRWMEELVVLVSGPMLTVGLGIALVSLLSDGALLVSVPWLLYAWAISQTVGVDGQLVGTWYRVSVAVSKRRWGVVLAFMLLGAALAYVGYIGALVFAMQQSSHIGEAQALAALGMDATSWLWQRSAISVALVCLSGYLRYRAPRQTSLADEQEKLQRELTLEPLRQRVRGVKLAGVRAAATALVGSSTGSPAPSPDAQPDMPASAPTMATTAREDGDAPTLPDTAYVSPAGAYAVVQHASDSDGSDPLTTPPTGPGSPVTTPTARTRRQRTPSQPAASLRLVPDRDGLRQQRQRQAAQGLAASAQGVRTPNESLEPTARAAFLQGATSIAKMERQTGMSHTAARHWVGLLKAEAAATTSPNAGQRIMPAPTLPLPGDSFRGVLSDDASAEAGAGYAL